MAKPIISTFKETPKTKSGKIAFILSLVSICSGPILGISASLIVPFLDKSTSEKIGQFFGFSLMIAMFFILTGMITFSIKAFHAGERSWMVLTALGLSILSVLFWMFMIIGEFLFPH